MVCTYEEYLKQSKAITFEKMQTIHTEMLAEIGADVEALANSYVDFPALYLDIISKTSLFDKCFCCCSISVLIL